MKKKVLIDTSSAIILHKANFIRKLIDFSEVIVSNIVFSELTENKYKDSAYFKKLIENEKLIKVQNVIVKDDLISNNKLKKLDHGELDTILLYEKGYADYIIIDDKKGAVYCRENKIPYINALLVPKIRYLSGYISEHESIIYMNEIISIGYYSKWIIDYAMNAEYEELKYFL